MRESLLEKLQLRVFTVTGAKTQSPPQNGVLEGRNHVLNGSGDMPAARTVEEGFEDGLSDSLPPEKERYTTLAQHGFSCKKVATSFPDAMLDRCRGRSPRIKSHPQSDQSGRELDFIGAGGSAPSLIKTPRWLTVVQDLEGARLPLQAHGGDALRQNLPHLAEIRGGVGQDEHIIRPGQQIQADLPRKTTAGGENQPRPKEAQMSTALTMAVFK